MCEMFPVKHKPGINLDMMFFVWQRANVMYVTGQRAMSLLLEKGRRGCWEKKAALIPRMPVLLWYYAQAVFVFRVWMEATSLCFCICVCVFMYRHVQWCCVGVGVPHHIYWYTVSEVGGWSCITWHNRGMESVSSLKLYVINHHLPSLFEHQLNLLIWMKLRFLAVKN